MSNEFGKFLEGLRGNHSLREVAKKSGLSHTYIRDLELGVNRVTKTPIRPTPETLSKLSEAYNYPYPILMNKAGYSEIKEESEEYVVSQAEYDRIISDTEKEFGINLRDDPNVLEATRELIRRLAKMKSNK